MGSKEGKDDNDAEGGVAEKGGGAGENQSGQGKNGSDVKNGSDASPAGDIAAIGAGGVGTVMLKPNSDNTLERENRKTSPQNDNNNNNGSSNNGSNNNKDNPNVNEEQGNSEGENDEGGSDSESSDGFLKGLQSADEFHGMLPDEDINKLLQYQADYILHTVEKDEGKGRVIGMSILWNKEKIFVQVRAGECGVTFDMNTYKPTILELTKYHLIEGIPVTTTKSGQGVIPRRPVLREDWELRHDDVELLEKLGEGAFGEVRLGKLKQKNKGPINVAVKVIKGTVTKKAVEEAMKEARIMRKYNHPNVVRFYGVQAEVEPLMLLMEFVKGGSLDSYLKKNRDTTTVSNRASMCYDAACGLEYLHLQDCIHRDIAARNCLMDISSRRLKISDFGLSSIGAVQVLDPSKPAPIRWLSPEVIRTGCFGKPADVWSFGILCWEIYMDAEVPYKEYTMGEVQKRIVDESFRLRLPLTCQTELRKLIGLCWIGEPNKRPTMSECVRTLKPFFDEKKKYMTDDAVRMVKKQKKHKKKKHRRTEKPDSDSKKSNVRTQQKGVSRVSTVGSPNAKGSGNRKRSTKPRHERSDDLKSKEKYHKKQSTKKSSGKTHGKTARKGESQKSDSDTDKASNSHKSGNHHHQKERKHRSQPRSPSPPTTNSKASSQQKKSPKKSSGGGKDRKKPSRQSGSDEDRKNRKGGGSDEDRKLKDSTQKKKNKNRRK